MNFDHQKYDQTYCELRDWDEKVGFLYEKLGEKYKSGFESSSGITSTK